MKKINFNNLPDTTTPINNTNLNTLQTNVEEVFDGNEPMGSIVVEDIITKNIFSTHLINGVYAYATGVFANSTVYVCSADYIPVIAGKQIAFSTSYPSAEIGIVYFNDNNERIGAKVGTTGIVPEGATKLVICIKKSNDKTTIVPSDVEWVQLEYGSATEYTPHKSLGYTSGSNENGSWVKYDDGRMECWKNNIDIPANTETQNIVLPQQFVGDYIVLTNCIYNYYKGGQIIVGAKSSGYFSAYPIKASGQTADAITTFDYSAKGYWK